MDITLILTRRSDLPRRSEEFLPGQFRVQIFLVDCDVKKGLLSTGSHPRLDIVFLFQPGSEVFGLGLVQGDLKQIGKAKRRY